MKGCVRAAVTALLGTLTACGGRSGLFGLGDAPGAAGAMGGTSVSSENTGTKAASNGSVSNSKTAEADASVPLLRLFDAGSPRPPDVDAALPSDPALAGYRRPAIEDMGDRYEVVYEAADDVRAPLYLRSVNNGAWADHPVDLFAQFGLDLPNGTPLSLAAVDRASPRQRDSFAWVWARGFADYSFNGGLRSVGSLGGDECVVPRLAWEDRRFAFVHSYQGTKILALVGTTSRGTGFFQYAIDGLDALGCADISFAAAGSRGYAVVARQSGDTGEEQLSFGFIEEPSSGDTVQITDSRVLVSAPQMDGRQRFDRIRIEFDGRFFFVGYQDTTDGRYKHLALEETGEVTGGVNGQQQIANVSHLRSHLGVTYQALVIGAPDEEERELALLALNVGGSLSAALRRDIYRGRIGSVDIAIKPLATVAIAFDEVTTAPDVKPENWQVSVAEVEELSLPKIWRLPD